MTELMDKNWQVMEGKKIVRTFKFPNFKEAITFVNQVAKLAEDEKHHPDIHISYNQVKLELWTHTANGLTDKDFILAAKTDKLVG